MLCAVVGQSLPADRLGIGALGRAEGRAGRQSAPRRARAARPSPRPLRNDG